MAPYDSDSSDGEDKDFTETNVLLGYASNEASDDTISHLGGQPTWLDDSAPPSATLAKCKVCNDLMVLLLQLNGDLPEVFPGHERRLYVLTCRRKTCRRKEGSVKVLRGVRISEAITKPKPKEHTPQPKETPAAKPAADIGAALFGGKPPSSSNPFASAGNPFSTATSNPFSSPAAPSNPFSTSSLPPISSLAAIPPQTPTATLTSLPQTFAAALSLNNPQEPHGPPPPPSPWPPEAERPPAYPTLYLVDADYETLDAEEEIAIPMETMDLDDGAAAAGGKEDKVIYESSIDKVFQKFADRLEQNPEQVIRYEFRGQPLLYSKQDAVGKLLGSGAGHEKVKSSKGMPRCGNCGGERTFEVQITPHAIVELERDEHGLDGMEWGTIIVGVCEKDCQARGVGARETGYLEEWAGVQWEESIDRR